MVQILSPLAFGPSRPANDRHREHNQNLAERVFQQPQLRKISIAIPPSMVLDIALFGNRAQRSAPTRWVLHPDLARG